MCTQQKINEQTSINSKISENQKQQLRPQSHRICSPGPCPYWLIIYYKLKKDFTYKIIFII